MSVQGILLRITNSSHRGSESNVFIDRIQNHARKNKKGKYMYSILLNLHRFYYFIYELLNKLQNSHSGFHFDDLSLSVPTQVDDI